MVLFLALASLPAAAGSLCPAKTSDGCASLFARDMSDIIKKVRTGRGPFQLVAVTSSGSKVIMTYRGEFTAQEFADFLTSQGDTKENFLGFTHADFAGYQCDGPIKDMVGLGVQVHNILTFKDGSELDSFDLAPCQ
ncbi:hypothetical protein ACXU4B_10645 [Dyella soli]|uniref:Uncharacterized protein n=1 Tax=Dyella soli TaxID=522319 RepID=A0A4R0YJF4_9GAMM|nr:hypothetical protein [Dyella soli]TCI07362.1 hypothetical protein EZM97_32780 [Dyella soli]